AQKRAIKLINNLEKELSELKAMARITSNARLHYELSSHITLAQKIVKKQEKIYILIIKTKIIQISMTIFIVLSSLEKQMYEDDVK
ncbi:31740_t:CDS:2, partial [Racocetra persica]